MQKHRRKPFKQGRLDAFCGPYALINAIHILCGPLTRQQASDSLYECLHRLERHSKTLDRLLHGTGIRELQAVLPQLVEKYDVRYQRIYQTQKNIGVKQLWMCLKAWLESMEGVLLIRLQTHEYDHWSIVTKITDQQMILFDSCNRYRIQRCYCVLRPPKTSAETRLFPTQIVGLWVEP